MLEIIEIIIKYRYVYLFILLIINLLFLYFSRKFRKTKLLRKDFTLLGLFYQITTRQVLALSASIFKLLALILTIITLLDIDYYYLIFLYLPIIIYIISTKKILLFFPYLIVNTIVFYIMKIIIIIFNYISHVRFEWYLLALTALGILTVILFAIYMFLKELIVINTITELKRKV